MDALIQRLNSTSNWKETLRTACKMNRICTSFAGELTPIKLSQIRQRFTKAYQSNPDSLQESWIEHEMKAFHWILIVVSSEKNVRVCDFSQDAWQSVNSIFQRKSKGFLRYEAKRFLVQKLSKNKNWAPDQNQVLCEIISRYDKDKIIWNEVARILFEQSDQKYFRTAKHCREHWLNYLDPSKNRGEWTTEQDLQLLQLIEKEGKKWAKLGQELKRTEHNVKNRYNSLMAKQKKVTPNIRKQQNIVQAAIKTYQRVPEQQKQERIHHPIRINLKTSSESLFNENRSEPYLTFHEIQPKNPLDLLQNYSLQGGQYVRHLLKDDQEGTNKNQPPNYSNFWSIQSPKNLTPMGFSPSPFSLSSNYNYSYYIQNFNMELKRQGEKEEGN